MAKSRQLDPMDLFDIQSLLTDEERMVKETVGRFVDDKVLPGIQDAFERHFFPKELISQVAELGLLGSSLDGYDCAGMNSTSYGLICQELERGDSGLRSFVSVQSSLVMYPIYAYGSEEQKQRWLPAMARGEAIGCFGLTESQGGSDPSNMKTHAKRDGEDWILNGSKMWITNATIADAAVVWAISDEGVHGFIVEKDMPGFTTQEIENKFSLRASITGALFFDNVRIPAENVNTLDHFTLAVWLLGPGSHPLDRPWLETVAEHCFDDHVPWIHATFGRGPRGFLDSKSRVSASR